MNILITGVAGFIGFHLAKTLLGQDNQIIGIDNLNAYYDVELKQDRLALLKAYPKFQFERIDLSNEDGKNQLDQVFETLNVDCVVNLAAQAGVRYSLENPQAYVTDNIIGFTNVLEACRKHDISHLVFASSSSVYGANTKQPFSEHDSVDHPVSFYAATKRSNELMAHTYSHLYNLPCTGLRFFTVYGPWGRPDMAYFKFTKKILAGESIEVYNEGLMERDFTYIDDIVDGIIITIHNPPKLNTLWLSEKPDLASSSTPFRLYNIGCGSPVSLLRFIEILELTLGKKTEKRMCPMQPGDVSVTFADISNLEKLGFKPKISLEVGIKKFAQWYLEYY